MNINGNTIIGELVAEDYRTAEVFAKHGIDFCCKGNQSITKACEKKNVDANTLLNELEEAIQGYESAEINYQAWPVDLLADYIEKKHHRYVVEKTPVIRQYLNRIVEVHGRAHPELAHILELFNESAMQLAAHMKKEELILFPFIRKMAVSEGPMEKPGFRTVNNPISIMQEEHEAEGERFASIAALSNNYTPPAEACNTYRVSFSLLKEFEADLHRHIHLENNILFPRAIKMEQELSQSSCAI